MCERINDWTSEKISLINLFNNLFEIKNYIKNDRNNNEFYDADKNEDIDQNLKVFINGF